MSGYHLHQSSRLESFPEGFPDIFLQKTPLSDPVYTVVQNSGLGEWLIRFLAKQQGAVMGPRILMPEQGLRKFASGYPTARGLLLMDEAGSDVGEVETSDGRPTTRGLLFMDGMKLTVFKALEEVLAGDDATYDPLRNYMASLGSGSTGGRSAGSGGAGFSENAAAGGERLWQLADALAGIFYHYGMNCLPLVEAWDRGERYLGGVKPALTDGAEAEAWQRGLWRRIFGKDAPYTHLSRVLSEVMASGESYDAEGFNPESAGSRFSAPPSKSARIVLFGSMFLGETGLRFFRYLAADFEVHHFILTPSKVFAFSRGSQEQGELFADPAGGGAAGGTGNSPDGPAVEQSFLRNNARLSAGFAALLPVLDAGGGAAGGITVDENWENPGEEGALLHRLRASMIEDAPLEGSVEDDGSLAFHNVSGPRRAVEVLKDRILEALRDDDNLAPTQIGVLAPDISRYAPYIESIFPSQAAGDAPVLQGSPDGRGGGEAFHEAPDHLNFNLTDLPSRTEAPYPAAHKALMELPGSRFGRAALLSLFANPCFAPSAGKFGAAGTAGETADTWRRIVEDLHIRWGVDDEHRSKEGAADPRTGAWETAFERLLAGYYHDEDDRTDLLPAELAGDSDADTAGELIHVIRTLDEELRSLDSENLSLKDWTLKWEMIVEHWLTPRREGEEAENDEGDRLRIKGAFRDLLALDEDVNGLSDFSGDTIPWSAFSSLLEEFTSPSGSRRGRYLSRGVTCASLKPTRAIPFRRIYILGLDEGAWPGREYLTGFDLRDKVPKFIDLSRESVDRFALLESIFSAQDHLSLFYTGRDPERGDPLSPAAPLVELFEHLGEGAKTLVRRHPLNPFHPSALMGRGQLASSSSEALALAETLYRGVKKPAPESSPLPPREDEDSLDWQTPVRFLKNPVEYFYRRRLETPREDDEADLGEDDVLEAGFLDWWSWRNAHISENPQALLNPETLVDDFRRQLHLEGSVADTPAGELQAEAWREEAVELADALKELIDKDLDIGEPFGCRFVPGLKLAPPEAAPVRRPQPGTILNLPAPVITTPADPDADIGETQLYIEGRITGLRLLKSGGEENPEVWTLLDFISGKEVHSRHNLRSWAAALMIGAALGEGAPKEIRVFHLSPRPKPLRRYFFRAQDRPGEGSRDEDIVVLQNPLSILRSLILSFRDGESSPLPLYPDLADKLTAADKKDPVEGRLAEAAEDAWYGILNNKWGSTEIRDCQYRQRYLKNPDFSSGAFARVWENLYRSGGIL